MKKQLDLILLSLLEIFKKEKGIALLTVVLFLFTLSIMGITFLSLINIDLTEIDTQYNDTQAFYLAEAGIEKAIWYLNSGELRESFIGEIKPYGSYEVKVNLVSPSGYQLTSTGRVEKKGDEAKVEVKVRAVDDNPSPEITHYSKVPGTWQGKWER